VCGAVVAVAAATVAFFDRYCYYYRCCDCDWRLADVIMVVGIGGKVDDDAAVGLVLGDDCDVFAVVVFDDDLVWEC
jgi:hypothetical protein